MPNKIDISKIKLSKSAHFYILTNEQEEIGKPEWEAISLSIQGNVSRPTYNCYSSNWEPISVKNNEKAHYGICIFRHEKSTPSFIAETNIPWTERKLGYFVVVTYKGFAAVQSKNITIPNALISIARQLDYTKITALNTNSTYSKISMKNINGGANEMRARTFIADDLSRSMSALGANHYMISAFNGKNNGKVFSVTTSTARVAERARELSISEFCCWTQDVIDNILSIKHQTPTDFLSIFAEYVDYRQEKQIGNLIPSSVLLSTWELNEKLHEAECTITYEYKKMRPRAIELSDLMDYVDRKMNEPILLSHEGDVYTNEEKKISIRMGEDGIILVGDRLRNVQIVSQKEPEYNGTLLRFINKYGLFNVYFDNTSYIYTQDGLFKNSNLQNNYDQLLSIFEPLTGLNEVKVEKHEEGHSFQDLAVWSENSIFSKVEDEFRSQYDYLICDDCADIGEWADHIGISQNTLTFFIEKCAKMTDTSATAFQEVVGQAIKNLGNMMPLKTTLDEKKKDWKGPHTTSKIQRWRNPKKGVNVNDAIDNAVSVWEKNMTSPNFERRMCLVVNFITKERMERSLRGGEGLKKKDKEAAFQRLWLLSSFVNACIESGVKPVIYCTPQDEQQPLIQD